MEIFSVIWNQYLYIPLFNLLIWLYFNYASYNLGIAVIILTIMLRICLMPFTILSERGKVVARELTKKIKEIDKDYSSDPVKRKKAIRVLLKQKKVRPWAKAVVLTVQTIVLVLLSRVFYGGIASEAKLHLLYSNIPRPDFINTSFLWFDIGQRDLIIPAIIAGYIFAQSLISQWGKNREMSKPEQIYTILLPAFLFLILAMLQSVKSIFILTSLIFSTIISMFTTLLILSFKKAKTESKSS